MHSLEISFIFMRYCDMITHFGMVFTIYFIFEKTTYCHRTLYALALGYEPVDLTVHPPQNCRGWDHSFRIGV